jgi:predicted dehydrogenase
MKKKYKAVVIGCGRIGAAEWRYPKNIKHSTHAAAFRYHPKIKLSGLCDIDPKKLKFAERFFPGVPLYLSAKKMLKEVKPDIVSVATRPDTHFKFVKMAANFRARSIICEKPISDSLQKAESMVRIYKEKKRLLFVAHLRHFDPLIGKWQRKVKKGILGKISQANCIYHNGFFNNGTHMVDILRWFLGKAEKVIGVYNPLTSNPKKDKNIDDTIFFKSGARAVLQSVPEKNGLTEWYFYGKKGNLAIRKLGFEINYNNFKTGKPRSLMAPMVSHIISCLEGKERPLSTGRDGLAVLEILFAIQKSANNKGKIIKI